MRFRGIDPSDALRRHVELAVVQHLGRFAPDVSSVVVRIDDVNGPRGGLDKHCRVVALGELSATHSQRGSDAYAAVVSAIEGLRCTLERRLGRQRTLRRIVRARQDVSEG